MGRCRRDATFVGSKSICCRSMTGSLRRALFHLAKSLTFMGNATAVEITETPGQALILWSSEDDGPCSLAILTLSESGGAGRFGPIPHPAFEATHANIADRIWAPAQNLSQLAGSPTLGQVATNPGYFMDGTSANAVATVMMVPDEWARFNVILWFASYDATTEQRLPRTCVSDAPKWMKCAM